MLYLRTRQGLIWPMLALILLPLAASWLVYPGTHVPPGFGVFPPEFVAQSPDFNPVLFAVLALFEAGTFVILLFPQWFGFRLVQPAPRPARAKFPLWFWIGAATMLFSWWLMWARTTPFGDLVYYAFSPLWWGFILVLDGIVYRRNAGRSLLATKPATFVISAVFSVVGWCYFEYYDYFVLGTWYYPNATMPELSYAAIAAIFLVAYSTVWPAIFEWYTLLKTCPKLASRYTDGPRLVVSGNLLMWGGFALVTAMVFFPHPLFWAIWVGPLAIFSGMLIRLGIWTPFAPLAQGNWTPMVLMAVGTLLNGLFWELWNYGSAANQALPATNPNYWIYEIPYVNVIHLLSEMPLLGYFGYLPFGILAWVMFIWAGKMFNFDTDLLDSGAGR